MPSISRKAPLILLALLLACGLRRHDAIALTLDHLQTVCCGLSPATELQKMRAYKTAKRTPTLNERARRGSMSVYRPTVQGCGGSSRLATCAQPTRLGICRLHRRGALVRF